MIMCMRNVVISLAVIAATTESVFADAFRGMSYLDNGTIRVGVDLDIGGAITYEVQLSSARTYTGTCKRLLLCPIDAGRQGATVRRQYIGVNRVGSE